MQVGEIIATIFSICGGLGTFLIGIKLMSDSMEDLADSGIKKLFGKISGNRLVGVGIGAASTALIQASAITTVMVVGFVNAGMMDLAQATTVIMGANIGTTITAQIAALKDFSIMTYAMALALIGILMVMMSKKEKVRTVGTLLGGLGLIFVGLSFTSTAMEGIKTLVATSESVQHFMSTLSSPVLLLLIGAVFTALIQSSSAVTVIVISFASAGIVVGGGGNALLYVILGSNVGTCVTAMLSAIGVQANAKRAALIHLLFNTFGAIIFFVLLVCWPSFMDDTFAKWFVGAPSTQIAMFHTFFNVVCTLIFLPFVGVFVKLAQLLIKDKKQVELQLSYLDERLINTPAIAMSQSVKEIARMGNEAAEGLDIAINAFLQHDPSKQQEVEKVYKAIAYHNIRITEFLVKVSANIETVRAEKKVASLHGVLGDIVRIADLSLNIVRYTNRAKELSVNFTHAVYDEVGEMRQVLAQMFALSLQTLEEENKDTLKQVDDLENKVDALRRTNSANHIVRLNNGECQAQSGGLYTNLLNNLERIADHLNFIAHSIDNVK